MKKYVVHCKKEEYDIYIGRGSIWGNPFKIGEDGSRDEVIEKYMNYLLTKPELISKIGDLKGKVLGCWCSPLACHGDVLAHLVNREQL